MKIIKLMVALALATSFSLAQGMFQTVPKEEASIVQSGKDKMYCPNCGMYLPKFWKTSHAVELKDGSHKQYCSIHCLVEDLEMAELRGKKESIQMIKVVDVASNKYIDARSAYYVVGSNKPGTMTMTSKYAFLDQKMAEDFAKKNGGDVLTFEATYQRAVNDFTKDMGLVLAKRSSKMWKMGEKLYNTQCDKTKIDAIHTHSMGSMKALIAESKACGTLDDGKLQALMLYVWDQKLGNFEKKYGANKQIKENAEKIKKKMMEQSAKK